MSRNYNNSNNNYAQHHPHSIHHPAPKPPIIVNDHDVLSGRGVNIAHHPGNERFRTLVTTRADESYCSSYSVSEKRAVALEVIRHIHQLDPPGRFLKRSGRGGQVTRGLQGPWEELTEREAIKKTCQALRDCNRQDRQGYAVGVRMPEDVYYAAESRAKSGLSGKQHAQQAAAAVSAAAAASASASLKRSVSPSVENAAEWLMKKQRTDESAATAAAAAAAAASAAAFPTPESLLPASNSTTTPTSTEANGHSHHHWTSPPAPNAAASVVDPTLAAATVAVAAYPPIDFTMGAPSAPAPPAQQQPPTYNHQDYVVVGAPPPAAVAHPGYHMDSFHPSQEEVATHPAPLNLSEL